ncbi:hypothetical protein Tco_0176239, partial [Tanacetum coccineum]
VVGGLLGGGWWLRRWWSERYDVDGVLGDGSGGGVGLELMTMVCRGDGRGGEMKVVVAARWLRWQWWLRWEMEVRVAWMWQQ